MSGKGKAAYYGAKKYPRKGKGKCYSFDTEEESDSEKEDEHVLIDEHDTVHQFERFFITNMQHYRNELMQYRRMINLSMDKDSQGRSVPTIQLIPYTDQDDDQPMQDTPKNKPIRNRSEKQLMLQANGIKRLRQAWIWFSKDKDIETQLIQAGHETLIARRREQGEMWKRMSDEEKEPFNKLEQQDKLRYQRECHQAGITP